MKLRKTLRRMLGMCPDAWYIFISCLKLTVFLLLCAFMLLLEWDGHMRENYTLYMTAMTLYETGEAVLLIGALLPVFIEDAQS